METPSKRNEIGSVSIGLGVADAVTGGGGADGPLDNTGVANLVNSAKSGKKYWESGVQFNRHLEFKA